VLAGAIGARLVHARSLAAAWSGAYLDGLAGELATGRDRGVLASELAGKLPAALEACRAAPEPMAFSS